MKKIFMRLLILFFVTFVLVYPRFTESRSDSYYENEVAVLVYHHVDETAQSNVTITPELFRGQLQYLLDKGYHFITTKQMEDFLHGGSIPDNAVFVTFDDGYKSFYTKAFPILTELGIPAVNFAITGDMDHPNSGNVPSMVREDIQDMARKNEAIEVNCHSDALHQMDANNKPYLLTRIKTDNGTESEEEYRKRIVDDTVRCRQRLSDLDGREHRHYAYPFGMYDKQSVELLKEAGIRYGYTTVSEITLPDTDPMFIPRINAGAPYISPEELHALILNKKTVDLPGDRQVPLGKIINQMGGKINSLPDQTVEIYFDKKVWTLKQGEKLARSETGETVEMTAPLEFRNKKNFIRIDDLERILQYQVVFYPTKNMYHIRHTPSVSPKVSLPDHV